MASIATRALEGQATWWATSPDGTGGDLYASPVLLACRWEDRQETYVGQLDRNQHVSKAIVFTDRAVSVGDYLAEGDHTSSLTPADLPNADKVQRYQKYPDLRNLEVLHKATL